MTIRKSLAYNKDFITGKSHEITKNKIKEYLMRGVFKVELFDALTKRKTYEAVSENRITPVTARWLIWMDFVGEF